MNINYITSIINKNIKSVAPRLILEVHLRTQGGQSTPQIRTQNCLLGNCKTSVSNREMIHSYYVYAVVHLGIISKLLLKSK
jgi:hypothetical protein